MILMSKSGYIIIAITIIVVLLVIFFVTYVLNKRTPVPKGCEKIIDSEKCAACNVQNCHIKETMENERKENK